MAEVPLPTPTDNAVPSTDIRDSVYAGAMLDKVVTSTELKYTDRLGGEHYTVDGIKAEGDKVVEETRQNLIPLSRQYMTLAAAQADIANIPDGSSTYYRSPDDSALAIEVINNAGTLEPTGRKMPSSELIDSVLSMISADGITRDVFMQWADKNGLVIAQWLQSDEGISFSSSLLNFGPEGFIAKLAGIGADKIFTSFIEVISGDDFLISDKNGLIISQIINSVVKLPGFTLNLPFLNLYAKKLNLLPGMTLGADGATITLSGPLQTVDQNGLIAFSHDAKGKVKFSDMGKLGSVGGTTTGTLTEKQVINLLDGAGAAYASKRHNQVRFPVPRGAKLKKLTIYMGFGQSFSVGGGSFFAIPDDIDLGNIMLGQSPRGSTFVKGLSSYDFGAVGGNTFQPLHEVRQTDAGVISETSGSHGQTMAKAFADEVKRRLNERMHKDNDTDNIFGMVLCGVAGAPIEDLSKGAAAGYYNRYLTALDGIVQAATAAGYEWEVGGILLSHGEQNNGATVEYYLPYLQALYGDLIADAMTASGQTTTPIFLLNQIGNSFISGRNFGVVEAQRQFVENNPLAFMVGSYAGLPNPVDHLFANSYRWLGAQFAKVADRVMWGNDEANFQMVAAYWSGNTAYAGFSTRVPPLKFKSAYVTYIETMYHDKGFTVSDGSGVLTGTDLTVSIVSDNVIKIVASRTLTGTVTIMLGDGTAHAGVHNVADSDTEISDYVWESGLPNQPATENIAALNNKHYSLANFALIQKITAEEF
ncbi:flagellar biosynthesis, cell-distal portion of basal-body rod [Klebsiella pneumoniae]|uniref:sialate O-acetylesterase n=3 Tax=Klebsiella TaxID=570 RepID=UPI000E2C7063|nr:flagellar biosynthesis, cell-distal portion of basal-body rod [Klebsiella pneumoniae]